MMRTFDPKKYDLVFCPICNGNGEVPEDPGGVKVCANCGGFGLIKAACNLSEQDEVGSSCSGPIWITAPDRH